MATALISIVKDILSRNVFFAVKIFNQAKPYCTFFLN